MPPHDASPERSLRSPLDGHAQPDLLARWKERLGAVALLVSLAWLGSNFLYSDQVDLYAVRGPVASVHQMWESQCSACHVSFTPISNHSWGAPFLGDVHESSRRCQTCHEGTSHHVSQEPALACGSCHREHRGRDVSLVRLPDSDCTKCHRDLSKHHARKQIFQSDVSSFSAAAHPEFRSIKSDPGMLKFNHRLHLTAGMAIGKHGGALMTLGKLPESFRQRYQDRQEAKDDAAPVQLQCASCHQLDVGERNAGAYMLPIRYENQCQACHPLTIERKVVDDPKGGYLTIPHRLNPLEIHELLANYYTAQVARGQVGLLDKAVVRPLPGKMPGVLDATLRGLIDKKVERAERDLYLGKRLCAECHYFAGKTPDLHIAPTEVPTVWLQHAKFNHSAHRAVQCAECHGQAEMSTDHKEVLIPDRDSCIQCHAPTTKIGGAGARFDCTECHSYHNGDHAGQGVGAASRAPTKVRGIDAFLHGE